MEWVDIVIWVVVWGVILTLGILFLRRLWKYLGRR